MQNAKEAQAQAILDDLAVINGLTQTARKRNTILKSPFSYVGNKKSSFRHLDKILPYTGRYIEVFGGSGTVLLNRKRQHYEVFNDRNSAIIDCYNVFSDPVKLESFKNQLGKLLNSRELWYQFKKEYLDTEDQVLRAVKWFYFHQLSFGAKESAFGRDLSDPENCFKPHYTWFKVANRLKNVLIENLDYVQCLLDFDKPKSVFYCDPPYLNMRSAGHYKYNFTREQHIALLETIMDLKGFVCLSGYDNALYNSYSWDYTSQWEVQSSMNNEIEFEKVWVKYAK